MYIQDQLTNTIGEILQKLYGNDVPAAQISRTKKEFEGDYTLVVFPYLKYARGKNPEQLAQEIAETLIKESNIVKEYNVVKGFLNLSLTDDAFIEETNHISSSDHYGHKMETEDSPLVMVEYSSPNTNKPLHLGHVRNNLLGYSLCKILSANGNRVVKTNIVNDRGIHICKSMLAWKLWGNGETPEQSGLKGDHLIGKYYVLFSSKLKEGTNTLPENERTPENIDNLPIMQQAREMLRKWEAGDEETLNLWRMMNQWVYDGFDVTYKRLGVDFDKIYYESDTYLVGKEEVLRGLNEGIFCKHEDGSVWADLTDKGLDQKLLLRADGTSVYMTQDIGTAKMRFNDFAIDKMIYVVGNEQNYHFQVLSLLLDALGFKFGKDLVHFSYGMVELPEGKMKSREGTVVDADDLMDEVIETAYNTSKELGKVKELTEEEALEVSRKVGLGALKYFLLKVDPRKTLLYDTNESIDFNGNTGPFLQYTYARIRSIVRNAESQGIDFKGAYNMAGTGYELSDKEKTLILRLAQYPEVVEAAGKDLSPALIANFTYDLAREYNQFYHDHSILNAPSEEIKGLRVKLSYITSEVLRRALDLLGIEVPEKM
ncbi:MAG: arginine--tRNA ligase [Porphyromonas sp.]|nr:arginine--tRNA ligase [Porphyromonas sp.]